MVRAHARARKPNAQHMGDFRNSFIFGRFGKCIANAFSTKQAALARVNEDITALSGAHVLCVCVEKTKKQGH